MTAFPWPRGEPATDWSAIDRSMGESSALARLWRGFMAARCCVAAILLIIQGVMHAFGQTLQPAALVVAGGYLVATVLATRVLPIRPPIRSLGLIWLSSIGVDLLAFASLQLLQGATINYSPLFALPVLMGAVLGTKIIGLGTTAAATLVLLAHAAWYGWLREGAESPRYVQAALTGTGLFVVALLAHELARRLTREEALAHRNRGTAQMHALVNDMVIETLAEGVLVIDEDGRVHAVNPAADAILGQGLASLPLPFKLNVRAAWIPLGALALRTFERRAPQSIEIPVAQSEGAAREVRVRTRLTPSGDSQPQSLCVMFLQDLRELEARIRTEKLAAMGRMS
ncbi:MAG: PAS domain-containing sensor histidine kinase, partial [Gammaproteobacteria bacterium]|nr:PAS domain-containing sensor histidine kinase [Gammaproteobacteria bacterium]